MASTYETKASSDGLTVKAYRGEGAALLAFDLAKRKATSDFVGFSIGVKYPGSKKWGALKNRLHFDRAPGDTLGKVYDSTEAPFQKFRWIHVPTQVPEGKFHYRVATKYMAEDGSLSTGASVEVSISLAPRTIDGFVNVGFTRGFASSQAYADKYNNEVGILPIPGSEAGANLAHDMEPFEEIGRAHV